MSVVCVSAENLEAVRASRSEASVGGSNPRAARLLAKRASEGEEGEVAREARGSLAKRAVCARVGKKNRDKP